RNTRGRLARCCAAFWQHIADRFEQPPRGCRDLLDRGVEGFLVLLRRYAVAADLAHELQRGSLDLVRRCGLVLPAKGLDASAHASSVPPVVRLRTSRHFRLAPPPTTLSSDERASRPRGKGRRGSPHVRPHRAAVRPDEPPDDRPHG